MKINDLTRFLKTEAYAKELGGESFESWKRCISNLRFRDAEINHRIDLFNDRCKYCFGWHWVNCPDHVLMVGGLILHGHGEVFSISVENHRYPYWSLCT